MLGVPSLIKKITMKIHRRTAYAGIYCETDVRIPTVAECESRHIEVIGLFRQSTENMIVILRTSIPSLSKETVC